MKCLIVEPGVCGFACRIRAARAERRSVNLQLQSACEQVGRLSEKLRRLELADILTPAVRNPVFTAAEGAGCHASCPIPTAVLKCAEAELGLALARDVSLKFEAENCAE